eukprot:5682810-Alexandrium_andersonii.AAC.1
MATIVHETYARAGLKVNWRKGKTEAMVRFAGKGSVEQRRRLLVDMGATVPLPDAQPPTVLR